MRQKIIYNNGDKLGPYQINFIEEAEPYVYKSGTKYRQGVFVCPYCNNNFIAQIRNIKGGKVKSCGCIKTGNHIKNIIGQHFGLLTVIKDTGKRDKNREAIWLCKCECGKEKEVATRHLGKDIFSCGCHSNISKGEQKIKEFLDKKKIVYITQKTFNNCRNPKTNCVLYFDFYIPDYNYCIEYDGIQHFKETNFHHDNLQERKYRDSIKNQYCKNNNIKIIRISYKDYDKINEILNNILGR